MTTTGRVRHILIAYDGGEPSQTALGVGIELAGGSPATVGVVSVIRAGVGVPDDPWSETSEQAARLHDARRRIEEAGLKAEMHAPTGPPGPSIVEVATAFGYDTIVIGSRRLGPIRRTLLGSVSRYVASHSSATVVIAR